MADVSVVAANVLAASGATIEAVTFGATITPGQPLYLDSADGECKLADNNDGAAKSVVHGISLSGGGDGQPGFVIRGGLMNPGFVVTVGEIYMVSAAAGAICPEADVGSGKYVTVLMVGITTSQVRVSIINSGVLVP